jgi:hypothetical protein
MDQRPRAGIIEVDERSDPVAIAKRILTAGRVVRVCAHGGNEVGFGEIRVGAGHFAQAAEQIRNEKGRICSHLVLEGCQMGEALAQQIADRTGVTVWGASLMMKFRFWPLIRLDQDFIASFSRDYGEEWREVETAFAGLINGYNAKQFGLEELEARWGQLGASMRKSCKHTFRKACVDVFQVYGQQNPDRGEFLLPHEPRK